MERAIHLEGIGDGVGRRTRAGFTLIEVSVVLGIVAVLAATGGIAFNRWTENQRARRAIKQVADLLFVGRSESIRTGQNHIAFFDTDTSGAPLMDRHAATRVAAVLIADLNGDFKIDVGEHRIVVPMVNGTNLSWGRANAPNLIPRNGGATLGDPFSGTAVENSKPELDSAGNFRHPVIPTTVQSWVLFAPDGTPRAFHPTATTQIAGIGTGDGAVYVNNGERDYAVVMSALGAVKTFGWDAAAGQWR